MQEFSENYAVLAGAAAKRPIAVVQIAFDEAETDLIYLRTGYNAPTPSGATVFTTLAEDPTTITQKIDPLRGTATIGHSRFSCIDPGGALTSLINTKLGETRGLRHKTVRIFRGYDGLAWSDMALRTTQIIKEASYNPRTGVYTFSCEDVLRVTKKDIFEPDKCVLGATITAEQTHIPVTIASTTGVFRLVEHDGIWNERPNETVGYLKINNEVICHTGFFTHSTDGLSFQVASNGRGALNTLPAAHEIDANASDDRQVEVAEWIFFEGPIPKIAYAILTGKLHGQTGTFPWNVGVDESLVRLADFTDIGDDLWNTSTGTGKYCRFENPKPQDGKKFIESELMMLLPGFMPVYATGELGLRRQTGILSDADYDVHFTDSNITKINELNHKMPDVLNKFRVDWNTNAHTGKPTKQTVLIDANSINTHGKTGLKTFTFNGLHTGRNTDEALRHQFNGLRSRYAGPPLLFRLETFLLYEGLEVGDIVRVATNKIKNWNSSSGTLDQSFEVQQIAYKPRGVELTLFGSAQKAGAIDNGPPQQRLPVSEYTGSGTNLSSVLTISNGAVTADDNLPAGTYYYNSDLTINSDVDLTFNGTVTLKINGHLQINGDLDGKGRGLPGGGGQTSLSGVPTVPAGYFGSVHPSHGILLEEKTLTGDGGNTTYFFANISDQPSGHLKSKGKNYSVPPYALELNDGVFTGYPTDLQGTGGRGGGACIFRPEGGGSDEIIATGGDGGDGGAGLLIIAHSVAFGPGGSIDTSGDDGQPGSLGTRTVSKTGESATYKGWSGSGAGGANGAVVILIDGNSTPPNLEAYVTATTGGCPLPTSGEQIPATGIKNYSVGNTEFFAFRQGKQAYSQTTAATAIQYVPHDQVPYEETEPVHQLEAPTGLTVQNYTGEAVTITSAGNRMQPVQINWNANTDPDCIGYEVRAKRTADSYYRTVSLSRDATETRGQMSMQQGDEYSVQARCISSSEGHSPWASLTYTPAITTDYLSTVGQFIGVPFPVQSQTLNLSINIDNNNAQAGLFKILEYPIDGAYDSVSFDGIFSAGASNGRLETQSRVSILFSTGSTPQTIEKKIYTYSAGEADSKFYFYYETLGDGTYTVRVYVWLQSYEGALLTGDWAVNTTLANGLFYSYKNVPDATTFTPAGTAIPATANYQTGATVGALPSEVDGINNAQTTADNAGSLAGSAQNAADNAQTTADNAGALAGAAQTTADNAGALAGSAQNAATAAQDTADLIPTGNIVPDPQFTKTASAYDTKYWANLNANSWYLSSTGNPSVPVLRCYANGSALNTKSQYYHPAKQGDEFSIVLGYYASPDFNSVLKIFISELDAANNILGTTFSESIAGSGLPTGWLSKALKLSIASAGTAAVRIGLSDRGFGSTGYTFVHRITAQPVLDYIGVVGTTRPEDNATVGGQLGTNIVDETSSGVDDLQALNANQRWNEVEGQQYTDGAHVIFPGDNQHLFDQTLGQWDKIASVYVPRYGTCRTRLVTQLGSYNSPPIPHLHEIEIRIGGATVANTTIAASIGTTYTIDLTVPNVDAGDTLECWIRPDPTPLGEWDGNQTFFSFGVLSGQRFSESIA